jgi:hypothetical protein
MRSDFYAIECYFVMAGKSAKRVFALDVPAIHVFASHTDAQQRRGCPAQGRA